VSAPRFLTEPEPPRGVALPVAPGILRVVANNPGPMTYHGTNTYLIEDAAGFAVLDPGPDDAAHVADILAATGGRVGEILLSHAHIDHVGALPALAAATGAPVFSASGKFGPAVGDGDVVGGWTALATPGHAPDHLCFARDGVLFSADHVMSFSSSVVPPPPDGDMASYMAGLRRLLARNDRLLLPGHGPPILEPAPFVADLLEHRLRREASIRALLREGPRTAAAIVAALYVPLDPRLKRAAQASVLAHLLKLRAEGRAEERDGVWRAGPTPEG
jgi:glyoxylase-like metal-dependent hydrolase (beta-lactamase superfamily II)